MHISLTVSPDEAIAMRHPDEEQVAPPDELITDHQVEHSKAQDMQTPGEVPRTGMSISFLISFHFSFIFAFNNT